MFYCGRVGCVLFFCEFCVWFNWNLTTNWTSLECVSLINTHSHILPATAAAAAAQWFYVWHPQKNQKAFAFDAYVCANDVRSTIMFLYTNKYVRCPFCLGSFSLFKTHKAESCELAYTHIYPSQQPIQLKSNQQSSQFSFNSITNSIEWPIFVRTLFKNLLKST